MQQNAMTPNQQMATWPWNQTANNSMNNNYAAFVGTGYDNSTQAYTGTSTTMTPDTQYGPYGSMAGTQLGGMPNPGPSMTAYGNGIWDPNTPQFWNQPGGNNDSFNGFS